MKKRGECGVTQFFYLNLQTLIFIRKMKQLKFLMVAFTLLMGISLTSCLDSSSESTYDGAGYVRTVHYMGYTYFVDLAGNKYYPTSASMAALKSNGLDLEADDVDLVAIYYKNVEDTGTEKDYTSGTEKSFDIELVGAEIVDSYDATRMLSVEDAENSVQSIAPIVTLKPTNSYGNSLDPALYGDEMVMLPIYWKMENKEETLKQHSFKLVYVEDETIQEEGKMVFYLMHDKGTDTKAEAFAYDLKAYDIELLMESYKNTNGKYPSKVVIRAKAATDGETMPEEYTDYEIDSSSLNN